MIGFGAQLSLHPPAEQFELVRRVEALGFDSVWTGDHVSFHNPIYESLTLLATYAADHQPDQAGHRRVPARAPRAGHRRQDQRPRSTRSPAAG